MLVILRENVEHLGRIGDLVNVTEGYARNYLLPRKLVAVAEEGNVKMIENQKKALEKKRAAQRATSEELAKKMGEFSCTISRKVGEHDKLFGSVSTADIADALKKAGYNIKKSAIQLEHPIKALGVHPVVIKLEPEVEATVKVWVVKEE
ncbi:MAG: 50S ribosomal protein L9 [Oligoflexia bacterium]|nr:50S ribosomal protein L9 [Oligoflexia bacterium]